MIHINFDDGVNELDINEAIMFLHQMKFENRRQIHDDMVREARQVELLTKVENGFPTIRNAIENNKKK